MVSNSQKEYSEGPKASPKEARIDDKDMAILLYLQKYGNTRRTDIIKAMGWRESTCKYHLNKLEKDGFIEKVTHDEIKAVYYAVITTKLEKGKPRASELTVNITSKEKGELVREYDLTPKEEKAVLYFLQKAQTLEHGDSYRRAVGKGYRRMVQNFLMMRRKIYVSETSEKDAKKRDDFRLL